MIPPSATPTGIKPVDDDLAAQAHPGHGIPSQDPSSAAQFRLQPAEAEREAKAEQLRQAILAGKAVTQPST